MKRPSLAAVALLALRRPRAAQTGLDARQPRQQRAARHRRQAAQRSRSAPRSRASRLRRASRATRRSSRSRASASRCASATRQVNLGGKAERRRRQADRPHGAERRPLLRQRHDQRQEPCASWSTPARPWWRWARHEAERLGLDYKNGRRGISQHGQRRVPVYAIKLASVRIGDVQVYDVDAIVLPAPMPYILLGNSFLDALPDAARERHHDARPALLAATTARAAPSVAAPTGESNDRAKKRPSPRLPETSMDLAFTPEEQAFREKIRAWVRDNLPKDISDKVRNSIHLTRDDLQRWAKILGKQGWHGWGWPKEFGGPGWNAIQKHLFEEEMRARRRAARVPVRAGDGRAGDHGVRHARAAEALPARHRQRRGLVEPGLQRAGLGLRPRVAEDPRRAARRQVHRQRPEDLDHARPVRRLDLLPRAHVQRGQAADRHQLPADRHEEPRHHGAADHHDGRRARGQRGLVRQRRGARRPT